MSDTCIVCLGDLRNDDTTDDTVQCSPSATTTTILSLKEDIAAPESVLASTEIQDDDLHIAHLLPCGHHLHNGCLKPWVERANSCPICRQNFNQVDLSASIGGPILSSYAVTDRVQVADVDPTMIMDDLIEEVDDQPCPVCRDDDHEEVLLACDGCDAYYHTYCVGLDNVPTGHWFCESCETQRVIESVCPPSSERPPQRQHNTNDRRTRGQQRRVRNRQQASSSNWARVWQSVWDNLNLDLDFPFDETPDQSLHASRRLRGASHAREMQHWERRLRVAERQGGGHRFRDTAPALLDPDTLAHHIGRPEPESHEEIRAWNAFEKAKEINRDTTARRKRKSTTTSPREEQSSTAVSERPLKRPRTRRTTAPSTTSDTKTRSTGPDQPARSLRESSPDQQRQSMSTHATIPRAQQQTGPSFLQSMLREIETSASNDDKVRIPPPRLSLQSTPVQSRSPAGSPTTSTRASPVARSITPPPTSTSPRPSSPLSLTSKIEPVFPHFKFSPTNSPANNDSPEDDTIPLDRNPSSPPPPPSSSTIPQTIPFSTKADLQKMVVNALKPHYQSNHVSKDQYTDINRNVSHLLYNRLAGAGYVSGREREAFERIAMDEVSKAVLNLRANA